VGVPTPKSSKSRLRSGLLGEVRLRSSAHAQGKTSPFTCACHAIRSQRIAEGRV